MKPRTLLRHFRESFKSLARNGWMTFASISAVTVTLLLVGVFLVIMMNLNNVAKEIEQDVEIKVYIEMTATEEEQNQLQADLEKVSKAESVVFSSKDSELESLKDSFGEDGAILDLFEQSNPLYDVFIVKTKTPQDTFDVAKQIEGFDNVAKVVFGQETVERLFQIFNIARNIGLALILGLVFTAMFLISNTIKITIFARRKEIEIMKLVGATNWFIRWPFFLEGLWLGVLGAFLPIAIILTSYYYLIDLVQPKVTSQFLQFLPFFPFAFQVVGILVAIGAFIGIWGSMMSVRKFLKV
ncbi:MULTISPECIES: permease-like cell division protein FtsX [Sutcliffiella]|uniref:Cell division protein FtsX n=1 Tax=Sutcliffiella cohnii TaxID=33932 RepID=A0A223KV22_9BACI|nr:MULTISPECIES: permease-like cell division protein FtsX [Sutcliffiella]AST93320.1 cell division protein FtsX [Sutcliffiella cohnii]WBL14480.1 permease-like cell division protein FtsX [Sutcliffiella sp. NC1]